MSKNVPGVAMAGPSIDVIQKDVLVAPGLSSTPKRASIFCPLRLDGVVTGSVCGLS
jgi:hypothetical protein